VNPEIVAAERAKEARDAARGWRRAGFIPEQVVIRVIEMYPDDRKRFGPGFRALALIFALLASSTMIGLWFDLFDSNPSNGTSFLLWALVLAALTELQRGPWRRADAGAESATALAACVLAVISGTIGFDGGRSDGVVVRFLVSSFLACSLAGWRWGDALFYLGGGLSGFGLLAQAAHGRLLWIAAALIIIPASVGGARLGRFAPSVRKGFVTLGAVAVLALYFAVHVWSLDQHLVESMSAVAHDGWTGAAPGSLRALSILATALLPPALFLIGWRRREPLLLYAGLLLIGASIATIRLYRQVMPLSFALILIGVACLALALGLRRWLRSGDKGERDGFTADPLFDNTNRTEAIRSVVAMASFTPAAQPPASRPAFEGGGGGFGGGGATGSYE
jgi:hypothetical protein